MSSPAWSWKQRCAAWAVHAFTATGAVAGLMALVMIVNHRWKAAFVWMAVTVFIDSVDGSLARWTKVKQVLPGFDGTLLDNIVDYFTYVIVPAYFLYEVPLVPYGCALPTALAITLASAYQFCQADAKTPDHYFKGFPSYWNVVVFYCFFFDWPAWVNLILVVALVIAVFLPVKYLYPSRTQALWPLTLALTLAWTVLILLAIARYPTGYKPYLYASFPYVLYYFGVSFVATFKAPRRTP